MTDKQTGARAAAKAIHLCVQKSVRFIDHPDDPDLPAVVVDVTSEEIEAIILRHCPDKAVERVVETAKHMVELAVEDSPDYWLDGTENLEAAIAEYERAQK